MKSDQTAGHLRVSPTCLSRIAANRASNLETCGPDRASVPGAPQASPELKIAIWGRLSAICREYGFQSDADDGRLRCLAPAFGLPGDAESVTPRQRTSHLGGVPMPPAAWSHGTPIPAVLSHLGRAVRFWRSARPSSCQRH